MSKHTELPWSAHFVSATGIWEVLSAKSEIVAECNTYAEAEYIVRTCNAFPAMKKACEKIMRLRSDLLEGATSMDEGALLANGAEAFDEIEAAIAKAGE